jgi:hypothetical protein
VLVDPNTAMLVVQEAPEVPATATGATTPDRAMTAAATRGAGRRVFT